MNGDGYGAYLWLISLTGPKGIRCLGTYPPLVMGQMDRMQHRGQWLKVGINMEMASSLHWTMGIPIETRRGGLISRPWFRLSGSRVYGDGRWIWSWGKPLGFSERDSFWDADRINGRVPNLAEHRKRRPCSAGYGPGQWRNKAYLLGSGEVDGSQE